MDRDLIIDCIRRLDAAPPKEPHAAALVRAALLGGAAVDRVLAAEDPDLELPPTASATGDAGSPGISLSEIVVEGFRGIGPEAVLELDPGRGLTLVVGRNGSGKSSFAEALELLLTGDSYRWRSKKSKVWREGWRNVHHGGRRRIELRLCQAGATEPLTLRRTWAEGDDLDGGTLDLDGPDGAAEWRDLTDTYRPILSYSELGSMLEEGPSKLYDALATVLGLDDLVAATSVLADARKAVADKEKEVKAGLGALQRDLADIDDERARRAVDLLGARTPDLDALGELATGEQPVSATDDLARARQLADAVGPDLDRSAAAAAELRAAAAAFAATSGTDADRALRTAELLRTAHAFHADHGDGDCPVCGRTAALDADWRRDTEAEIARLDGVAAAARQARDRVDRALADAHQLLRSPSPLLNSDVPLPVDATEARGAWAAVAAGSSSTDPTALADHLDTALPPLAAALARLSADAEAWWTAHQDQWRPHAEALAAWVGAAREARTAKAVGKDVTAAEKWLILTTEAIQAERFAPTADQAKRLWDMMRCASNVSIDEIALTGRATRRSVDIGVSVDGESSAALGVMSQGELNTLALSLFLPRATLEASPFRFVVIDDPVQSMDPARVDGLARVLHEIARTHQVVVFTHDDRLHESVRRLQIPAQVISVQRRVGSQVDTYVSDAPAKVYLRDARHVMKMRDVPPDVRTTVVPTLYRQALEAAALDVVRRRWITAGRSREDVEADLSDLELATLMSFVVVNRRLDDKTEIYGEMRARLGSDVEQAVSICNRAAHEGYRGDLVELGSQVESAVAKIGALT